MLKHVTKDGDYWGVSFNYERTKILIQLNDNKNKEETRLGLSKNEALAFLEKLKTSIDLVKD